MTCCEALTNCTYMNPFFLILKYEGFIQKHHPYTGNLNRETSGDSTNAFVHCGDVSALTHSWLAASRWPAAAACHPAVAPGVWPDGLQDEGP